MTITLTAQWEVREVRRGINIMRRKALTGTACGMWLTPGTYHATLAAAREYVDKLPVGHFCGPGQIVRDE